MALDLKRTLVSVVRRQLARVALKQPAPPPGRRMHAMTQGTRADWAGIRRGDAAFARDLADRLLGQLRLLRDVRHGFAVDRLEHCLQTASRAHRAGNDEEYVVCALFHDVGASLAPADHATFAALALKPYVSERNLWLLQQHDIFQGYYYLHFLGHDRHARDRFRGHPAFEYTAEFCEKFDQAAFDPTYESMPLEAFVPMVRRVINPGRRSGRK